MKDLPSRRRVEPMVSHDLIDFQIRRGGPADVALIREFARQAYAKWAPLIGREPFPMSANYDESIQSHRFDLIYQEDELAALIETIDRKDYLMLENLCVRPDKQRMGLSRRLLNYVEILAVDLNHKMIRLETNKLFEGNVSLYLRHGYVIDWEKPINGGVLVHMYKGL